MISDGSISRNRTTARFFCIYICSTTGTGIVDIVPVPVPRCSLKSDASTALSARANTGVVFERKT